MWYVYDKRSTVIQTTVKTPAAAKGWITRRQNEFMRTNDYFVTNLGPLFDLGYAEVNYFHDHIEKKRRVRNLMTGDWVDIDANTPRACDPSTELYWSM